MSSSVEKSSLYAELLGAAWPGIPAVMQRLYGGHARRVHASGHFQIGRGRTLLARAASLFIPLPGASEQVHTTLEVHRDDGAELWHRNFGGHLLITHQRALNGLLCERFGPIEFDLRVAWCDGKLCFNSVATAFRIGPIRMRIPRFVAPRVDGTSWCEGGEAIHVSITLGAPLTGLLVRYDGVVASEGSA